MHSTFLALWLGLSAASSTSATQGAVTVWSDEGYTMKARNEGSETVTVRFTYSVVGRNAAGDVVSTVSEEYQVGLQPRETRHLFTVPQDPARKVAYAFGDVAITGVRIEPRRMTTQEAADEKRRARQRSGQ